MLIDSILYINLKRRPDRDKHMRELLKTVQLTKITKIEAIDGKTLIRENINNNDITSEGINDAFDNNQKIYIPLTIGAIGCALSHKKCYQYIIDNNIDCCLILEDDVQLDPNFNNLLKCLLNEIPKNFDIFALGHSSTPKCDPNFIPTDTFYKTSKFYGLFGYIVSNKGAQKLLNIFPITKQIDTEISNNLDRINAYVLFKPIIFSEPSSTTTKFGTDIQIREKFNNQNQNQNNYYYYLWIFLLLLICYFIYKWKFCK